MGLAIKITHFKAILVFARNLAGAAAYAFRHIKIKSDLGHASAPLPYASNEKIRCGWR